MKTQVTERLRRLRELSRQVLGQRSFWIRALLLPGLVLLLLVVLPVLLAQTPVPSSRTGDGTIDSLRLLQAFLQQRLEMARSRQVGLVVDLPARRLTLEIAGLPVREVSIQRLRVPTTLRKMEATAHPFVWRAYRASIPRYPITEVEAPDDTLEAQQRPPILPPREDSGGVWVYLAFDRGLELWLLSPTTSLSERLQRWLFVGRTHLWREARLVAALLQGDATIPVPVVLELPPSDIRAVFRALPDSARLALRY